jgi:hypothetical protein
MPEIKTSKDWLESVSPEYGLVIMDPDGWDRTNYHYSFNEELITIDEFKRRVFMSTIKCNRNFIEDMFPLP